MRIPPTYYWQKHHRYLLNGRLAWYAEPPDKKFWFKYWKERLNTEFYESAKNLNFYKNSMGKILLKEINPKGLHLEAGSGPGYWVMALISKGFKVEGIEFSKETVKLVHSVNPKLPIRCGNALAIDYPDCHFDSYLSFGVMEHRYEGPEPFLIEAYRVIKPGGKIIISVPYFGAIRKIKMKLNCYSKTEPLAPFFQYSFSKEEFKIFFKTIGFKLKSLHVLFSHRLLIEEIPFYRWLTCQKGGGYTKMFFNKLLHNWDGHILLAVGIKPEI